MIQCISLAAEGKKNKKGLDCEIPRRKQIPPAVKEKIFLYLVGVSKGGDDESELTPLKAYNLLACYNRTHETLASSSKKTRQAASSLKRDLVRYTNLSPLRNLDRPPGMIPEPTGVLR